MFSTSTWNVETVCTICFPGLPFKHSIIFLVDWVEQPSNLAICVVFSKGFSEITHGFKAVPLWEKPLWNNPEIFKYNDEFSTNKSRNKENGHSPLLLFIIKWKWTLPPPAEFPPIVTELGFPPKYWMYLWINWKAAIWSFMPLFPGTTSSSVLRKPWKRAYQFIYIFWIYL